MKSLKLLGLSLLAVFALGVFAAASASAEEGFLVHDSGTPTLANILGGVTTFEAGKQKVSCAKLDETHVTFLNDKHADAILHWLGCKAEGLFALNSLGDKSEEILVEVLFLVCLDPKNAAGTLIDEYGISAEIDGIVHLEVPAVGSLLEVKGQALGAVLTSGEATLFNVELLGSKGKPTVTDCLEGKSVKLHNLEGSTNHGPFEPLSVNIVGGLIQFPEPTVLMDS